jgi:hypothetical protein
VSKNSAAGGSNGAALAVNGPIRYKEISDMVSFEDMSSPSPSPSLRRTREPLVPGAPARPVAERANEDFEKRYARPPKRRVEPIRFTAEARFMGRWSAP